MIHSKQGLLARLFKIQSEEIVLCLLAAAMFFCLLSAYYILRPIRDSLAITGGVENIHWLFTATFLGILVVLPIYGWACSHIKRIWLISGVYASVILALLFFWYLFALFPDDLWLARAFYVWISVINLLMISVFWSLMVDVFSKDQSHRIFGIIAAGGSLGGLVGPLLSALLVEKIGHGYLLLISAFGFLLVILLSILILRFSQKLNKGIPTTTITGHAFSGFSLVFKTPYLWAYACFVLLMSALSTFLYFQQAELVSQALPSPEQRTELFAWIDFGVNSLAIFSQLLLTGNIVKRYGITIILSLVPLILMVGFISFVVYPQLTIVVTIIMIRRVGAYAFIRPCREMLFTPLSREMKYKAKSFIDTVVYRGGDALSGWFYNVCIGLGLTLTGTAVIGAVLALLCSAMGIKLGRIHDQPMNKRI